MQCISVKLQGLVYFLTSLLAAAFFGGVIFITMPVGQKVSLPSHIKMQATLPEMLIMAPSPFPGIVAAEKDAVNNENSMPAYGAPTPPEVPAMPGNLGKEKQQTKLTVISVLPPNVVILNNGSKSFMGKQGDETNLGTIDEVTMSGAVIGGKFYPLSGVKNHADKGSSESEMTPDKEESEALINAQMQSIKATNVAPHLPTEEDLAIKHISGKKSEEEKGC